MQNKKIEITKRQKDLLTIIYEYIKSSGYPPNFEEMREALCVTSNQSVIDHLKELEKKQIIKRNKGVARSIALLPVGYKILGEPALAPFLGITSAGAPIEAMEITGEWQSLPTYKTGSNDKIAKLAGNIFFLKIYGDSMLNAGINDGDEVLVKEEKEFVSGDIVLVHIGDEVAVKRFISDDNPPYVYLKPENPKYDIIPFTEEMEMQGKVLFVLRSGQLIPIK